MKKDKLKILAAGSALMDSVCFTGETFLREHIRGEKGGWEELELSSFQALLPAAEAHCRIQQTPGGAAANTAFGLMELGIPTAFLGKLGMDDAGEQFIKRYAEAGGDPAPVKRDETYPTGHCLCFITPDSERTMRTYPGAAVRLTPEEITDADFQGITHVLTEGYFLFRMPVLEKIFSLAEKYKCPVIMDLSSFEIVRKFRDILPELLKKHVAVVCVNRDEAAAFSGGKSPEDSLEQLSRYVPLAIVKLGKEGALIRENGRTVHIPAEKVNAADTTGAGDLWLAGFLAGYLTGKSHEQSGRTAAAVAAEVVQVTGAHIPPERWEVLRRKTEGNIL